MKILRANAPQQTIDEVDESLSKPDFGANWHPSYVAPSAVRVSATVVGGARSLIPTLVNRDPLASLPNQKAAGHTQFETDDPRAILAEQLSHCFILESAADGGSVTQSASVDRWLHLATRYVQRGLRPLIGELGSVSSQEWTFDAALSAINWPLYATKQTFDQKAWAKLVTDSPLQSLFLAALKRDGIEWLLHFGYPEADLSAVRYDPLKEDSGQGRRCDWVFAARDGRAGPDGVIAQRNLIVELDGVSHHGKSSQADLQRDEVNRARGYETIRLTKSDLESPQGKPWRTLMQWAQAMIPKKAPEADLLDVWAPTVIARIRMGLVRAIANGWVDLSAASVEIKLVHDLPDWAPDLALVRKPLAALATISGNGAFPNLKLSDDADLTVDVRIGVGPFATGLEDAPRTVAFRSTRFPTRPRYLALPEAEGHGPGFPVADLDAITSIATDAFGVTKLRPGQFEGIAHAFSGRNGLSVLPTSGGKSLIYWIAALCTAGLTIAVAPLKKLIDDQEDRLCNVGIDRVVATHSGRKSVDRGSPKLALRRVQDTFLALLTPERLQRRRFRDKLQGLGESPGFAYVVVDEAHCVSEWGHDFRPAYLRVAAAIQQLSQHDTSDSITPLIALTATASPAVQIAMLRDLGIGASDILRAGSTKRRELTFKNWVKQEVEPASKRRERASNALVRAGELLGIPQVAWVSEYDQSDASAPSAIVFTPTKTRKSPMGVYELQKAVRSRLNCKDGGAFDPVTVFHSVDSGESADVLEENAQRFMANKANIMVSTKAFGMGIDKPNIRVTVHASMPSSIEQFVQEAGRAGRDGKDAIGVLVGNIPSVDDPLVVSILKPDLATSERKKLMALLANPERENQTDLDTILYFLDKSRPGEADEIRIANSVLDSLIESAKPRGSGQTFEFDHQQLMSFINEAEATRSATKAPTIWRDGESVKKFVDVTMVRLHQIGFIQDFAIEGSRASQSFTVDFAEYSVGSIKTATLQALDDLNVGRRSENEALVRQLPESVEPLLRGAVRLLIEAIYAVIMPARMRGIAELIRIATGPADRMGTELAAYMDGGEIRERLSALLESLIGSDSTPVQLCRVIEGLPPGTQAQWRGEAIYMLQGQGAEVAAFRAFRAIAEWVSPDVNPSYAMDEFIGELNRWPVQEAELAIELAALAESGAVSGSGMASGVLGAWIRKYALSTPAPDQLVSAVEAEGGMGIEYRIATNAHKLLGQLRAVAV
jgi:hypothetical protein